MFFQIITFGCKLNQAESDTMAADLISAGFILARTNHLPDLIILNVCAVTHKAVREGRQKSAYLKRKYPMAKIIVTGCIENQDWAGVDLWIKDKDKIVGEIRNKKQETRNKKQETEYQKLETRNKKQGTGNLKLKNNSIVRVRALIKIQTGCDKFCAYCIVPFTRGTPVSRDPMEIIKEILAKEQQGYREIVLTGVNIGLYKFKSQNAEFKINFKSKILNFKHNDKAAIEQLNNRTMDNIDLIDLLKLILKHTNIERIRLSSLWPTVVNSDLINLIANHPRLCPHFHLSIQSGSDKILKLMGRDYTAEDVIKIVNMARAKIPLINFTADIIAGFPGETEADFQDSQNLIKNIGCSKVHVFKYSARPGTKAALMPNQISETIKQARSHIFSAQAEERARGVKNKFLGQKFNVLWETKSAGYWQGYTENYLKIRQKAIIGGKKQNIIEQIRVKKFI